MNNFKFKHEIAEEFGLKMQTFRAWLKKYDLQIPRGLVSPSDQKKIYDKLGYPSGVNEDDFLLAGEEQIFPDERED